MSRPTKRSLSLGALVLVAVVAALSFGPLRGARAAGESEAPAVTLPTAVEVALLRAGISPESLAAAGVSGTALAAQLAESAALLIARLEALANADASHATLRARRDRLQRLVRSGQGTSGDVEELAAVAGDFASAEAARVQALDSIFTAATTELAQGAVAVLAQVRANAGWKVPVKYKVSARGAGDWLRLRDALAHVRTYTRYELELLSGPVSALAAFDGEQAVSSAASNLATHLTEVEARWRATFSD